VLDDRTRISTPEGIDLELTLAGAGSRLGAGLVDGLVQGVILFTVIVGVVLISNSAGQDAILLVFGIFGLMFLLVVFGYPTLFDTLNAGRTPGKALFGLRVVMVDGGPVTFTAAAIRNVLRLVDFLPSFYVVGALAVVATQRHQRIGDLAARTMVVRDVKRYAAPVPQVARPVGPAWDVTAVTSEEVAVIRQLLARKAFLLPDRREELLRRMAGRLRPKVGTAGEVVDDDQFLQRVVAWKRA
jgi:uncharacterized RDD family membrane protein YckC